MWWRGEEVRDALIPAAGVAKVSAWGVDSRCRCSTGLRFMLRGTAGRATQDEFMLQDQCILVDDQDRVVGNASKYDAHRCGTGSRGDSTQPG